MNWTICGSNLYGGRDFPHQSRSVGAPNLLYNGCRSSFPEVKLAGFVVYHLSPSSVQVTDTVVLYVCSSPTPTPLPSWHVMCWILQLNIGLCDNLAVSFVVVSCFLVFSNNSTIAFVFKLVVILAREITQITNNQWIFWLLDQYFDWHNIVLPPLLWRCGPTRAMASSFLRFRDHTQRRITVGRTPLDEWSARRRDLYLTTLNSHNRQTFMPPVGFEPTISAGERPQTYSLDRAATGNGQCCT